MVQKSRPTSIIYAIFFRILLLIVVLGLGAFTSTSAHELNQNIFGYQKPAGFFGFTLDDWMLAWTLASVFWSGLIFGIIGKKTDYIIIVLFFLLALFMYFGDTNTLMYLGLIGATILGNIIGFVLKLLRLRFFAKK